MEHCGNPAKSNDWQMDDGDLETNDRSRACSLQPQETLAVCINDIIKDPKVFESLEHKQENRKFLVKIQETDPGFPEMDNFTEEFEVEQNEILNIERALDKLSLGEISSEELIMNEDINWLITNSSAATDLTPSFTYTKTDLSSFLGNFYPQGALKSLPQSPNWTSNIKFHSFLTADPWVSPEKTGPSPKEAREIPLGLGVVETYEPTSFEQKDSKCYCAKCLVF